VDRTAPRIPRDERRSDAVSRDAERALAGTTRVERRAEGLPYDDAMPPPTQDADGPATSAVGARDARARRLLLVALLVLLPFLVYVAPYVVAVARGAASPGVATFTVDEPLYLTEAWALREGRPSDWNPWTRARGATADTYRVFAGALLPAAAWELTGLDRGLGLGIASGVAAALAVLLTWWILRRLLPPERARWAAALAPLAVLLPWGSLGEILLLRLRWDDLGATLPMARPFTSQWGPVAFLLGLWTSVECRARGGSGWTAALCLALLLEAWTFPYAVPLTLGTHLVTGMLVRTPRAPSRRILSVVAPVLAALAGLAWAATRSLPAELEAAATTDAAPRLGGSGVLLLALGGLAWILRRRFRPETAPFLPVLAALLTLGRVAGAVLPARLQVVHHVAYFAEASLALTALAVLPVLLPALRPRRAGAAALALLTIAVGYAGAAVALAVPARAPRQERHATWARAMSQLPAGEGMTLLTEGEDLDGPGAWAALLSPLPVLYSVMSEYSTMPTLEDRQWRRAWYHHLRGLSSEDVVREGEAIARRFPRIFGAHNTAPAPQVLPSLTEKLRRIEEGSPAAVDVLRSFGTIVCVEATGKETFRSDRLDRFLAPLERRDLPGARCTLYAVRGD
jgi:hypothetical protein